MVVGTEVIDLEEEDAITDGCKPDESVSSFPLRLLMIQTYDSNGIE